jgi:hypothetical protein
MRCANTYDFALHLLNVLTRLNLTAKHNATPNLEKIKSKKVLRA